MSQKEGSVEKNISNATQTEDQNQRTLIDFQSVALYFPKLKFH